MSAALLKKIEPFPTSTLIPYDPGYLAGWTVERYQIDLVGAAARARAAMDAQVRQRCADEVPGDTQRNLEVAATYSDQRFKHILVPVWLLTYTYGHKVYQVAANGVTGNMAGDRPVELDQDRAADHRRAHRAVPDAVQLNPGRRLPREIRMRSMVFAFLWLLNAAAASGQPATIRVETRSDGLPAANVDVVVRGATYKTDAQGVVVLTVPAGATEIAIVKDGFHPQTVTLQMEANQSQQVVVDLVRQATVEEDITVSATRTDTRLEDQPMRVEVLSREEIEEKMLMTPGDIVMMLNEMGGMRVQATSPSLGAASVRIQGMRGRYTRFLSDGLPLFGEQVGGLGLLQIPPMDLGQVEVIKGVASSLYGAGAMGGVVNLVSRRPGAEARARGAGQPLDPRRDRRHRLVWPRRSRRTGA